MVSPLRTEPSFTALNVGFESPQNSKFCAGHRQRHHPKTIKAVRPTFTKREAHRLCDAQNTEQKRPKD